MDKTLEQIIIDSLRADLKISMEHDQISSEWFLKIINERNDLYTNALKIACEIAISQEIDDEPFYDVIEDWKDKNGIDTIGVDSDVVFAYCLSEARRKKSGETRESSNKR